jgi:hypothetical protein
MPKSALVVALLVPLGVAARVAPAAAQAGPPSTVEPCACRDVTGSYTGTWGAMTLQQQGTHVTGRYAYQGGALDGTLDGDTLRFTWVEDDGAGHGVFQVMPDGSMQGTWGIGDSETDGGPWVISRSSSAEATAPDAPASGWTWGLRVPWNVQFTPHNISMGAIGLTLDVGKRFAGSSWYLGGSAEWEAEVDMTPPDSVDGPAGWNRLRLGGEARYYLGDGTASVSVNDGPEIPVPRHDWIGLRAGTESIDEFAHRGEFADLTYGWDADVGIGIGMTLTAGVSVEPSSVFPGNAANDPGNIDFQGKQIESQPATYVSPYLAMGIHLQF